MANKRINVYCRNIGWLFEDLKREIARHGAIASEKPIRGAAAYICIRTREAHLSPRPLKTVVQSHDMQCHTGFRAGMMAFVHPVQPSMWPHGTEYDVTPIGAREIPQSPLPEAPTIGFFCREVEGNRKGSPLFAEAVRIARKFVKFNVLLIGERLEPIFSIGAYEKRGALPADYGRIDALVTCSVSPMVPLSAYEAIAAGRRVISTPRQFPSGRWDDYVLWGQAPNEIAARIVEVVENRKLLAPYAPYTRTAWAKRQVELAKGLL